MKNRSIHRVQCLAVIALVLVPGCRRVSFTDVPGERTLLINGLSSYSSIAEVRASLGEIADTWEVKEESSLGSNSSKPRLAGCSMKGDVKRNTSPLTGRGMFCWHPAPVIDESRSMGCAHRGYLHG